ncbi:MAG TPA: LytTR family DNA-binding domain-containing protein [Longimicrobiales bacterium]
MILQDLLYRGGDADVQLNIAAAQYFLPWLTWAALAPALLLLFDAFPINLGRPAPALLIHAACGILVVGVKLLVSAPLAAWLIWQPLGVSWTDGVSWLLANRSGSNLLIFWALLSGYTAYRYYRRIDQDIAPVEAHQLVQRIPVRAGAGVTFIPVEQVTVIESARNHAVVFAGAARHLARATLRDLESRLPGDRFVRVHRSRIVNVDHVTRIEPWGRGDYVLVMRDGARVLSGKTYRSAVKHLLDICPA